MKKIGIIAGGGKLPILIANNILNSGKSVIFFCIEPFAFKRNYKKFQSNFIKLENISKIINLLKKENIKEIIMAGHIKRPSIKDFNFDYKTIKFFKEYVLQPKGDDKLLSTIVKFFKKEGFNFIAWKNNCKNLFVNESHITIKKPNKASIENLHKGLEVFKKIGKIDVSQSLIIQNNFVLGIEAAEGTDELIKRCYKYKKKGEKGVLIKSSKYKQDLRFDVPVIGLNTLKLLKKYNYDGIFIEKNNLIILDKQESIDFCNNNSLFISSFIKP
tara:strand:+ start:671 stop:1486 length:816 start_codon:yes stop_codon:yes gene_type:complete